MREFKSSNGLTMVEGKLFNWRKESLYYGKEAPYIYCIYTGGDNVADTYEATYEEKTKELCIFRIGFNIDFVARFICDDIYVAEIIVNAFLKGNHLNIKGTIYELKSI
jgi:hypothetical protein